MQQIEIADYVNEQPRSVQEHSGDVNNSERRLRQLLLLSFGLVCFLQATLNVTLRLALYSSKELTEPSCNATDFSDNNQVKVLKDCEQRRPSRCNNLQERFNALTREKNQLENRNSELANKIRNVQEERDQLKRKLEELGDVCVSTQRCPVGWREINSRCYLLSEETRTWEDSRKYCQSKGADLAVIKSEQEQRALYRLNGNADLLCWIGLFDINGNFKWVDGSEPTQRFWQSGQPDHGGPNIREDCVEMYHRNPPLANWNDAPCGHRLHCICEKAPCMTCV